MPYKSQSICSHPHCSNSAVIKGKCEHHWKEQEALRDTFRLKPSERGYDHKWNTVRKKYLEDHPECERCGEPATQVHHKVKISIRPDLRLDPKNLEALCNKCHGEEHKDDNLSNKLKKLRL